MTQLTRTQNYKSKLNVDEDYLDDLYDDIHSIDLDDELLKKLFIFNKLTKQEQDVWLLYMESCSYTKTAATSGLSIPTVRQIIKNTKYVLTNN